MKRILLIEDNAEILENTSEILELAGYKVFTAENGKSGVEAALQHHPDLIICDVMMPVLDGYGVFHLIRKNAELVHIPFIFLTAKSERSDFRKGMEMGADDYITKPFNDTELLNAVESRLEKMEKLKKDIISEAGELNLPGRGMKAEEALQSLLSNRAINKYKKKQPVFAEGNHPQYLFYVQNGKVKVFKSSDEGKELTVGLYAAGDFLGYLALLENAVYKVSAEAMEDTEIALIPRDEFLALINSNQEVAMNFIRLLAKNNNEKVEKLVQIAYNSLRKRVANTLLTLLAKYRSDTQENFSIHISREDLANLSGTATESLIRTLTDFKHEKLIEIKGGDIVILNKKKLADLMN